MPTQATLKAIHCLLNYANTYKNTYLEITDSNMILYIDTDETYLVLPKARSQIVGYFWLCNHNSTSTSPDNGAIHVNIELYTG